jgi:predicted transposase/invertase (TIGR01784 family)
MAKKKRLKDLTIKHNFMFGAVMCDEENCRELLERVLNFPIERVEVSKEKSILYHPEYKGVRLDVYAKDEKGTHYDIEMQALQKSSIVKRSRYYHSQMDMEFLLSGEDYDKLPNSYVIFVCDFDPFKEKKYCYTFENLCLENRELHMNDGCRTIFLSTKGENDEEVPKSLVRFLKYVKADLAESMDDFGDEFVAKLQRSVKHIKESREMEDRFMLFQELLRDERAEGRAEGLAEGLTFGRANSVLLLLEEKGVIPEDLREKIMSEKDTEVLEKWLKLAAKTESMEQFLKEM